MTDLPFADVADRQGNHRQAHGRAAKIIWLCLVYQDRINASRRPWKLILNGDAGEKVKPDFSEQWEEV